MKGKGKAILKAGTGGGGKGKPSLAAKPYVGNKGGQVRSGKASNASKYSKR